MLADTIYVLFSVSTDVKMLSRLTSNVAALYSLISYSRIRLWVFLAARHPLALLLLLLTSSHWLMIALGPVIILPTCHQDAEDISHILYQHYPNNRRFTHVNISMWEECMLPYPFPHLGLDACRSILRQAGQD
jgi:hypothetical protein